MSTKRLEQLEAAITQAEDECRYLVDDHGFYQVQFSYQLWMCLRSAIGDALADYLEGKSDE